MIFGPPSGIWIVRKEPTAFFSPLSVHDPIDWPTGVCADTRRCVSGKCREQRDGAEQTHVTEESELGHEWPGLLRRGVDDEALLDPAEGEVRRKQGTCGASQRGSRR